MAGSAGSGTGPKGRAGSTGRGAAGKVTGVDGPTGWAPESGRSSVPEAEVSPSKQAGFGRGRRRSWLSAGAVALSVAVAAGAAFAWAATGESGDQASELSTQTLSGDAQPGSESGASAALSSEPSGSSDAVVSTGSGDSAVGDEPDALDEPLSQGGDAVEPALSADSDAGSSKSDGAASSTASTAAGGDTEEPDAQTSEPDTQAPSTAADSEPDAQAPEPDTQASSTAADSEPDGPEQDQSLILDTAHEVVANSRLCTGDIWEAQATLDDVNGRIASGQRLVADYDAEFERLNEQATAGQAQVRSAAADRRAAQDVAEEIHGKATILEATLPERIRPLEAARFEKEVAFNIAEAYWIVAEQEVVVWNAYNDTENPELLAALDAAKAVMDAAQAAFDEADAAVEALEQELSDTRAERDAAMLRLEAAELAEDVARRELATATNALETFSGGSDAAERELARLIDVVRPVALSGLADAQAACDDALAQAEIDHT